MSKDFSSTIKKNNFISQVSKAPKLEKDVIMQIDTDKIKPNPLNQEIWIHTETNLDTLVDGIKRRGFDSELRVYDMGDGTYQLYGGERRWRASQKAGIKRVPCIVKPYPNDEKKIIDDLISDNVEGRSETPLERANAILIWEKKILADFKGDKNQELAKRFNTSVATIKRLKALPKLIKPLQDKIDLEDYPYSAFYKASSLNELEQRDLLTKINEFVKTEGVEKITRDKVDKMIDEIVRVSKPEKTKPKTKPNTKKQITSASSKLKTILLNLTDDDIKNIKEEDKKEIKKDLDNLIKLINTKF